MEAESVMNYVLEKLKELLLLLENFGGYLLDKFDAVFPPETRGEKLHHWLVVSAPFLISGVALLMLLWCCRRCCCGRRAVKMMKAPGRNYRMPRHVFQSNPRSYFRDLHGNQSHHVS